MTNHFAHVMFTAVILFTAGCDALFMPNRPSSVETCNTETRELEIVREVTVDYQGASIIVNCVGTIIANECEGACLSKVSPSVHRYPEFDKECSCCKEGSLSSRAVTLTECYRGNEVIPDIQTVAHIQEPINCSCQTCRN